MTLPLRASAGTPDMLGKAGWTAVMYGTGKDPQGDSQAGAADTDIIADAIHGSLYVGFSDSGTTSTTDDYLYFRLRIDNPTATNNFAGVAVVGMDADGDGDIDIFMTVDGRNSSQFVRLMDPGTDANISPSTTSTAPLPAGWLPNNGFYPFTASNYAVVGVTNVTDPHWNSNFDLGLDGKQDAFVSWRIPLSDMATVLAIPSPVDRNGNYGPRGATGIAGYDQNTTVRYVSFTQTQNGPINGDLLGVGASYDKNATFASLGTFTDPMSASNPVSAGPGITITEPISGNGIINDAEDNSVSISGTSSYLDGATLTLTVTDGTTTVTGTTTVLAGGAWTVSGLDLSGLNEGTLTVTATADPFSDADPTNDVSDTATVEHDKTPPTVTIDQLATTTAGTPTLTGTSDLPDGSLITIAIDPDNNTGTANLTYQVVLSGGVWTLDTATVSPVSGTFPSSGLTAYAKITATATDASGNTATATSLNRPTVNSKSTNDTTPALSGNWTYIVGDVLTITVSGATYTLSPSGNTWTVDLGTATPSSGSLTPLVAGNTYEVVATVTRSSSVSDTTSNELTITLDPVKDITIDGGPTATSSDTTPTITGTSQNSGGFVIVRLDPNNDGDLSDAVTFSVTPDGGGNWTLDTGTATPISGTKPAAGFIGDNGVLATDSTGAVSDTQVLTVTVPTITISSITSTATTDGFGVVNPANKTTAGSWLNITEDDAVTIAGTATDGFTVDVVVSDANGHSVSVSGVAVTSGSWSAAGLNLSSLDNTALTVTATLSSTSISATNTTVTHDEIAPIIFITAQDPIKKTAAVITGRTDLPVGTLLTVEIYDGVTLKAQWTSITNDALGYFTTSGVTPDTGSENVGNNTPLTVNVYTTTANTTDTAGNITQTATKSINTAPSASVNSISITNITGSLPGDGLIEVAEIGSGVTVSGSLTLSGTGTMTVTVTDGTTTVTKNSVSYSGNTWSTTLTTSEVQSLQNGQLTFTATVVDAGFTLTDAAFATLNLATPTLAITDDTPGVATGDVTFTFTFSEAVTGFDATDITVANGTKGTFSGSGDTYTLVVTPTASSSGDITVSVASSVAAGASTGRGNTAASATQPFDTTGAAAPPTITIDTSALVTDTTPLITGTCSLQPGAPIVIEIDTDNDGITDLTYSATVQSGGTWSLDIATATPVSGTLTEAGLDPWARITATAENSYGNSTTVTGLNTPTVTSLSTNTFTPTLTGYWTQVTGDTLTVVANGTTYTAGDGNLSVTATNWSLVIPGGGAYGSDGTYSIAATVTRASDSSTATDLTSNELTIDTSATVTISGGETVTTGDSTPVISGISTGLPAGTVLTLSLDTDNNGGYDLVYKTTVDGSGNWSVDTGTAIPYSGTFPSAGLNGTVPVSASATDPAGNTGTDTQTLIVDTSASITITTNAKTSDTTPLITGTTDIEVGGTISVTISGATYDVIVQSGGNWSVDLGTATPTSGTLTPLVNGNTYTITASGTDAQGNFATTSKPLTIDTNAPGVTVTEAIDSIASGGNADGTLNATEDGNVVITGTTANVPDGSTLYVTISDGTTTISDTTTVTSGVWSLAALDLSGMDNGLITVTATYIDDTGSAYSDTGTVLHNKTLAAGNVTIDSITQDTDTLADFITKDNTLVFSGSAATSASVSLTLTNSAGTTIFTTSVTADASGAWTYDYTGTTLADDTYGLTATSGAITNQDVVVDTTLPSGPVTVNTQSTSDTTPTITGTATVGAGETLTVTVNGVTYTDGDGNLTLIGTSWTLNIPASDALTPANAGGGFNGVYNVTATITDTAGNALADSGTGELTVTDTTLPVIDLDPSDGGTVNRTVSTQQSTAVSLDDNADPATVVEASDKLTTIDITVGGLLDGASEKLIFGSTTVAANGSSGTQSDITVGGVRINVTYAGGVFTLQKYDFTTLTAAEAEAIIRDIQYQDTAGAVTPGNRTFAFTTTDDAGNTSASATATVLVVGPIDHYDVTANSPQTAGVAFTTTVTAQDSLNNTVTSDSSTVVTMTDSGSAQFDSDGNGTFDDNTKTLVNGTFTISTKDTVAETITLTATDATPKTGTSGNVVINAAAANKLAFVQSPTDASIDTVLSPAVTVQVQDAFGNSVAGAGVSVAMILNSGTGSMNGTTPQLTDAGGLATFNDLSFTATGSKTIQASSSGLSSALSGAFTIYTATLTPATGGSAISADTAAAAPGTGAYTTLTGPVYTEQLAGQVGTGTIVLNAPSGFKFNPGASVTVNVTGSGTLVGLASATATVDPGGDTITITVNSVSSGGTSTLTWSGIEVRPTAGNPLASGNITKTGTSTMVAVQNGVTNFGTLGEVPGAATNLVIDTQPSSTATVGTAFAQQPVIRIEDQFGNVVTGYSGTVTATRNAGSGTLGGTTTVTVSSGIATFSNLSHDTASTITLDFTAAGLTTATSTTITVTGGVVTANSGTNYWLAMPGNFNYATPSLKLLITGSRTTTGTVSIPGLGFSSGFSLTANSYTTVTLPATASVNTNDGVVDLGINVAAGDDVTVHGANLLKYTSDGYLALGANALGTEYIALGQKNGGSIQGSQLTVVASEDGTTVTITPSVTTGSRTAGTPYTVSLNSGEVYQLRNTNNATSADLSGTIITADKAVGVYGGHQAGNVPVAMGAADHLVEMLTPVSAWGKRFFAAPLKTRTGYTLRLAASVTGTTVTTNGVSIGAALTRGEVREMILSDEVELVASAPVEVAQYAHGQSYDNATGDPAMLLISPQEQYLGGYELTAPSGYDSYVTLVSPAAGVGSVTVDGTVVASGDFTAIGASGYSYARVSVSAGAHQLGGTRPFGAWVYGWAANEGYAYPAGMNAAPVGSVSGFALSPATANNAIGAEHCLSATVTNTGSALQFDGVDDYVDVAAAGTVSGTFTVEFWAKPNTTSGTLGVLGSRTGTDQSFDVKFSGGNLIHADIGTGSGWLSINADASYDYSQSGTFPWVHVAYAVTSTGYTIYTNGVQAATGSYASATPLLFDATHLLAIGWTRTGSEYMSGQIDEVRVWNTARTGTEIQNNMNAYLAGSESGLVALWRLNEGTGAAAADATSNNNDGTLTGGPTWAAAGAVGIPLEGVRVDFNVAGNNTRNTFVYSDANGLANYCYTDNSGAIGSDTITAQIGTASQTATANWGTAGAPTISGLSSVSVTLLPAESSKLQSLSATINDSNTGSVTVTWKVDGVVQQSGSVSSGTADSFDYVYAAGTHDVVVTVDDGTGNVSSLAITVTVLDTTAPTITLSGSNPLTNNLNVAYSEPGYTASDVAAGDLTGSVTVSGTVDTSTVGTYQLTYSVVDSDGNTASVTRTVRVVDPGNPVVTRADTTGTDYWLAFPGNVNTYTRTLNLLINSPYNTFGTVAVAGLSFSTNFTLSAGAGVTITVPNGASVNTLDGTTNLGIHVTAQDEVTVHGANLEQYTGDGYLGLPTDALGTEYIVLSQKNGGAVASVQGSQLTVVASENATTVTITPSVATGSRAAGTPYTVSLSQGEVYQLRNTNNTTSDDLSGTIVTADKPVGVFGGNRAGYVPTTNAAADHLVEMLTPVDTWGTLFFTVPLASRTGYTVRLVASENGTTVTTNGVSIGTSLARGAVYEMILTNATVLGADKPVEVAQYAHGAAFDKATGDPFMMLISPVEQYVADYRVTVPSGYANYVTLISPSSEVGTVTVDGVAVGSGNFTAIGGSGYSYAQVSVSAGAHHFSGSLPGAPAVYGWKGNESYGYPAGMNLAPLTGVDVVSLTPVNATKVNGTSHTVTATVGTAGKALQFTSSSSQRVEVADDASLNFGTATDFTLEMWVKLNGSQTDYTGLLVKGSTGAGWTGYQLVLYGNKIAAEIRSGANQVGVADGLVGTTALNDGKWHHVAMVVTRSTTNAKLYVDGAQEADVTSAFIGNDLDNSATLYLGVERTPVLYLNGSLDEARVWNTARTPAQIQAAMNLRLTGTESGLVGLWRLDEGTGTTAADATSNGNDGTLVNTPTWITSGVVPAVPAAGVRVDFSVTGVNSRVGSSFTDANGQTSIIYTDSTGNGTDTITGAVGAVSGTATVTWGP